MLPSLLMVVLGKLQPEFLQRIGALISGPSSAGQEAREAILAADTDTLNNLITLYSISCSFLHSVRGLLSLEGLVLLFALKIITKKTTNKKQKTKTKIMNLCFLYHP